MAAAPPTGARRRATAASAAGAGEQIGVLVGRQSWAATTAAKSRSGPPGACEVTQLEHADSVDSGEEGDPQAGPIVGLQLHDVALDVGPAGGAPVDRESSRESAASRRTRLLLVVGQPHRGEVGAEDHTAALLTISIRRWGSTTSAERTSNDSARPSGSNVSGSRGTSSISLVPSVVNERW